MIPLPLYLPLFKDHGFQNIKSILLFDIQVFYQSIIIFRPALINNSPSPIFMRPHFSSFNRNTYLNLFQKIKIPEDFFLSKLNRIIGHNVLLLTEFQEIQIVNEEKHQICLKRSNLQSPLPFSCRELCNQCDDDPLIEVPLQ